jgi:Ca-activated chloride channel family protein
MNETLLLLDPWFLLGAPVAALVFWLRLRRPRAALPAASLADLRGLPRTLRARLVRLPEVLRLLGILGLVLAVARPVTREPLPLRSAGVDILLVLDVSSSMQIEDMAEDRRWSRIDAARAKATEFSDARAVDRVGLLTFALFPDLLCPPTLDRRARAAFLTGVRTVTRGSDEDRTAIGVALAKAVTVLEKQTGRSKVVVLLTDGENNVSELSPAQAGKLAKGAGVRVHTIGLGHGRVMQTPFGMRSDPADFSALQQVSTTTGGRFFAAEDAAALGATYAEIDRMEKTELEEARYRTKDWFLWPLLGGVVALGLALLVELAWLRGAP